MRINLVNMKIGPGAHGASALIQALGRKLRIFQDCGLRRRTFVHEPWGYHHGDEDRRCKIIHPYG
jgi:hypothetical protein